MRDVDVAIAVALEGAAVVRRRFGTLLGRVDKGRGDFATEADIEAEQAMTALLRIERPKDAVLGEETGRGGGASEARIWLIDPLCGTLNYAAAMRVAAVNAALVVDGACRAAAVADPFSDEVFWTDGETAWLRFDDEDRPLVPGVRSTLVDLNLDPPFPNGELFSTARLAADPGFRERFRPRVVSTSLALTWVATGRRAAYVTDGTPRMNLHFAAPLGILEAAGCVVTDLFGRPWGKAPTGILAAADRATHEALLTLIRNQTG